MLFFVIKKAVTYVQFDVFLGWFVFEELFSPHPHQSLRGLQRWELLSIICLLSVPVGRLPPPALIGLSAAGWLVRLLLMCVVMSGSYGIHCFNRQTKTTCGYSKLSDLSFANKTSCWPVFLYMYIYYKWIEEQNKKNIILSLDSYLTVNCKVIKKYLGYYIIWNVFAL